MNIAIVGHKEPERLANVLYDTLDGLNIVTYSDINDFSRAMNLRPLDFHRMLLFEGGIEDSNMVSDTDISAFHNMIDEKYPAMKIITISTDIEFTKYFASIFNNNLKYGHFCSRSLTAKTLVDFIDKDISQLYKIYKENTYREKVEVKEEILDLDSIPMDTVNTSQGNESIPGYIPPTQVDEKRGFFSKLFGTPPKKAGNLDMESKLVNIGQSTGQTEFSEEIQGIDFEGNNENSNENSEIFEQVEENEENTESDFNEDVNPFDDINMESIYSEESEDEETSFQMFDSDMEVPGITVNLKKEPEDVKAEIPQELKKKEEYIPFDRHKLEKKEYIPSLDMPEREEVKEEFETPTIDVPIADLNTLKEVVQQTNFDVDNNAFGNINIEDKINIDVEDAKDVTSFDDGMLRLMDEYENRNIPAPPKVIIKNATETFRNKMGIRLLLITGDRRIGTTKLALNLANKLALMNRDENVLYVDFDRTRHGSLGYLDLENILAESEHVQNGLVHLKNIEILKNICHYYGHGKFFTLTSMYGENIEDSEIVRDVGIIASQRIYSTVIIDCPLEDLYLMTSLLPFAKVLICAADNKVGIINLVTGLAGSFASDSALYNFYERSYFVIGHKGNQEKFKSELNKVVDLFGLDESKCDWKNTEILSSIKDIKTLLERVAD